MNLTGRWNKPAFALYRLFWRAMDWIYPPICPGCQKLGSSWCPECAASVTRTGADACPKCGQPGQQGQICPACAKNPPPFLALRSFGVYQGALREAIHRLKYLQDMGMGEVLAPHLVDLVKAQGWTFDLITSVPLSRQRIRERGYNQAEMLAIPLALALNKPYYAKALARVRNTASQVGLTAAERLVNVQGAFNAKSSLVEGKTILVVDDVTTTGATIQACTTALIDGGAAAVYGLTLARAVHRATPLSEQDRPESRLAPNPISSGGIYGSQG